MAGEAEEHRHREEVEDRQRRAEEERKKLEVEVEKLRLEEEDRRRREEERTNREVMNLRVYICIGAHGGKALPPPCAGVFTMQWMDIFTVSITAVVGDWGKQSECVYDYVHVQAGWAAARKVAEDPLHFTLQWLERVRHEVQEISKDPRTDLQKVQDDILEVKLQELAAAVQYNKYERENPLHVRMHTHMRTLGRISKLLINVPMRTHKCTRTETYTRTQARYCKFQSPGKKSPKGTSLISGV